MTKHIIPFPGFSVEADSEWQDVTEVNGNEPFTLARGVKPLGALQFSTALFRSGPMPLPTSSDLMAMAERIAEAEGGSMPFDRATSTERLIVAALSFKEGGWYIRLWCLTDGINFMLVTYTCDWNWRHVELRDCEEIVSSIHFGAPNA